jgi:hypothetical protein
LNDADSVKRLQRNARLTLPVLVLMSILFRNWEFGLSVLVGGLLADVNFIWMERAVNRLLIGEEKKQSATFLVIGFVARILLILLGLFAMIHFSFFRLLGAVLGASIFVLAGFIEAAIVLFRRQG